MTREVATQTSDSEIAKEPSETSTSSGIFAPDDFGDYTDYDARLEKLFQSYQDDPEGVRAELEEYKDDFDFNHFCDGWAPIHYAVKYQDQLLLEFLLSEDVELTQQTEDGERTNILHLALKEDGWHFLHILLMLSTNEEDLEELFKQKDSGGGTVLDYLAKENYSEFYDQLFTDFRFLTDYFTEKEVETALAKAIKSKNEDFIYYVYLDRPELIPNLRKIANDLYGDRFDEFYSNRTAPDARPLCRLLRIEDDFIQSIKDRDISNTQSLRKKICIECVDEDGFNALEHAARNKNYSACAYLLYQGINDSGSCPTYQELIRVGRERQKRGEITKEVEALLEIRTRLNHLKEEDKLGDQLFAKMTFHRRRDKSFQDKTRSICHSLFLDSTEAKYYKCLAQIVANDSEVRVHLDQSKETAEGAYLVHSPFGVTLAQEKEIYIGASRPAKDFTATMVHEFCHYACQGIWHNNSMPYSPNSEMEREMEKIYATFTDRYNDSRSGLNPVLREVFEYERKGKEKMIKELIVRVPQIIVEYGAEEGEKILREQLPELLKFYEDKFLPSALEHINRERARELEEKLTRISREESEILSATSKELAQAISTGDYAKAQGLNAQISALLAEKTKTASPTGPATSPLHPISPSRAGSKPAEVTT